MWDFIRSFIMYIFLSCNFYNSLLYTIFITYSVTETDVIYITFSNLTSSRKFMIRIHIITTTNLTFCDIIFNGIKKMPLIHIFNVIIIGFYLKFHHKVI